ncbi:NADAR family protein [uncultured Clostridium sp.]|uniref:NADAR family protein n=1 Tax=uncultured Clostridium sp. TaxID=59620 RepID=UPI0026F3EE55|nr:NADAR family protein [uncultured Clostridium sp.]
MKKQLKDYSLQELVNTGREFEFFWKGNFSQWAYSPFKEGNVSFKNMEQYMMYKKALLFKDEESAKLILANSSPKVIKQLGRGVKGFKESVWNDHKYSIVKEGNILKYSQNKHLLDELLATGNRILVEASPYDRIWGIGLSEENPDARNPFKWRGQNLLGFALTEVKELLQES